MTFQSAILFWLIGALVGSMLFFAFTVAPTVFRALPAEHAGSFLRALFPNYYLWGLIVALLAAALAMATSATVGAACLLVALLFVFARQTLMPRINHARDQQSQGIAGAEHDQDAVFQPRLAIDFFRNNIGDNQPQQ